MAILEATRIRIGNRKYAEANHSYGLTTLRPQQVVVDGATSASSSEGSRAPATDGAPRPTPGEVVARCRAAPGRELFQYADAEGCGSRSTPRTSTTTFQASPARTSARRPSGPGQRRCSRCVCFARARSPSSRRRGQSSARRSGRRRGAGKYAAGRAGLVYPSGRDRLVSRWRAECWRRPWHAAARSALAVSRRAAPDRAPRAF